MMKIEQGAPCHLCGKGTLQESTKNRTLRYKHAKREMKDLVVYRCHVCGEGFYSKDSERKKNRAFADLKRLVEGLLTSDEIKLIREQVRMTQDNFSALLGMAPKTISRYENGVVIQSKSVDNLLRLVKGNPGNVDMLRALLPQDHEEFSARLGHRSMLPYHQIEPYAPPMTKGILDEPSDALTTSLAA